MIGTGLLMALILCFLLWIAPIISSIVGHLAYPLYLGLAIYPFFIPDSITLSSILIAGVISMFVSYQLFKLNDNHMRINNSPSAEWAARYQSTYLFTHLIVLIILVIQNF
mgnify:FL=1